MDSRGRGVFLNFAQEVRHGFQYYEHILSQKDQKPNQSTRFITQNKYKQLHNQEKKEAKKYDAKL